MFKPLLAPREVPATFPKYWDKLQYPLLGSPKYDGIRGYVKSGVVWSRTAKPLPSLQVQDEFGALEGCDGEVIEGLPTDGDVYNRTQSHVMSEDKPGELTYFVFDYTMFINHPFSSRHSRLMLVIPESNNVKHVPQVRLNTLEELLAYEESMLTEGFEGIMLRSLDGLYKMGRATMNEGIIFKLKRFIDTEGILVDLEEQLTNTNIQERDELGYAKRSSAKAGMVGAATTGKFMLQIPWKGSTEVIPCAPGNFNHKERKDIWDNWPRDAGKAVKFRYFAHGIKDLPRHPRAIGFRDERDM